MRRLIQYLIFVQTTEETYDDQITKTAKSHQTNQKPEAIDVMLQQKHKQETTTIEGQIKKQPYKGKTAQKNNGRIPKTKSLPEPQFASNIIYRHCWSAYFFN